MQRSRLTACAFPFLAYRLPIPFQRFPHWFPILRRRFHHYFLGLLLDQPCSERSQLFGVAAKHTPLKLVLADNFHVRHNHCQHLFMNIDSRYSVGHHFLLAESGERAAATFTRTRLPLNSSPETGKGYVIVMIESPAKQSCCWKVCRCCPVQRDSQGTRR